MKYAEIPAELADAHPGAFCMGVVGGCMEPVAHDGDLILVDPDAAPTPGTFGIFSMQDMPHGGIIERTGAVRCTVRGLNCGEWQAPRASFMGAVVATIGAQPGL